MQAVGLQTYIWNNNLRSIFLLAGFPFLLFLLLYAVVLILVGATGGHAAYSDYAAAAPANPFAYAMQVTIQSLPLAIAVAVIWFVIAYFANQTIIDLATGARPIERSENEELYNLLENLCISRGMKTPALRIIEFAGPERLRHRPARGPVLGHGHARPARTAQPRRARGGAGPRADPHHQSRRPHDDHRRGVRRDHQPRRSGHRADDALRRAAAAAAAAAR